MLENRLRSLREELGLKQTELAEQIKINRVTYNRYETGERQPDLDTLKKLAVFFNVTTDYLLGQSNIKTEITTIAAHRTDDPMDDLPPEAIERVEEFIELMRIKYQKKPTSK